jgi:hypothetical protein
MPRRVAKKGIYGACDNCGPCICLPAISPLEPIGTLINIVDNLETLFRDFFRTSQVVAPLQVSFSVPARISPAVGVRLIWKDQNPGVRFNREDDVHRLQIKVIYQTNGWNWDNDPLFKVAV